MIGDQMSVKNILLFVFADELMSNLISTVEVEFHAR